MDEHARGTWRVANGALHLTTLPRPTPAVFSAGPTTFTTDSRLVLHVTSPTVPIYGLRSRRFALDLTKGNVLKFVITPNDLGTVDFADMRIDVQPGRFIMHRRGGLITFVTAGPPGR